VGLEAVIRVLLDDFDIRPRRHDWQAVLDATETLFERLAYLALGASRRDCAAAGQAPLPGERAATAAVRTLKDRG
jgi:hypothetical protein